MNESKSVFVLLPGKREESDHYQLLQEEVARATGRRLGLTIEVEYAPAFDQLRVLKKRFLEGGLDAAITEPSSVSTMDLLLRELRGRAGLVLLNTWAPSVEEAARGWGDLPFATISTHHERLGRIQGKQVQSMLPEGGTALCVTGPQRSSAAQERLEGLRASLGAGIELLDTAAGEWTETAGGTAFGDWYRVSKARNQVVSVIAAQSDELAIGVRSAIERLADPDHKKALQRAKLLGMDACPSYGQRLVDEGSLTASIVNPAATGPALELLDRFWKEGSPVPLRSFTEARPYPDRGVV